MELRLYDTKSRKITPLDPVEPGKVGIYLCGPTVQGSPHIGHLRAAVAFDVLVRWLKRQRVDVTYIRNITDIDDKILAKADEAGEEWWELAARYEREFSAAYDELGLVPPTFEPRATAHIIDQIELVQTLLDSGHAYGDGRGNVYFDVHSQPDYGSLTNQALDDLQSTEDPQQNSADLAGGKRDPRDFALWKAAKPDEPQTAAWSAPWGRGRPGWHLECSAMSHRYLGETFDIHGGGLDLRFPHHENEQAQSHAAGWDSARMWVHNAWVTQSGEKMAKSLGNTLALENLLADYSPSVIRLALGTVHYRSMIEWDEQTLPRAAEVWDRLSSFVESATAFAGEPDSVDLPASELPLKFQEALNDDLNVAEAMAAVYEQMKLGRQAITSEDRAEAAHRLLMVRSMLDVLGIDPGSRHWSSSGSREEQEQLEALEVLAGAAIAERNQARAAKDWERADQMRERLAEAGITVEDGPQGSTWKIGGR